MIDFSDLSRDLVKICDSIQKIFQKFDVNFLLKILNVKNLSNDRIILAKTRKRRPFLKENISLINTIFFFYKRTKEKKARHPSNFTTKKVDQTSID